MTWAASWQTDFAGYPDRSIRPFGTQDWRSARGRHRRLGLASWGRCGGQLHVDQQLDRAVDRREAERRLALPRAVVVVVDAERPLLRGDRVEHGTALGRHPDVVGEAECVHGRSIVLRMILNRNL